ncbi:hypothetical protein BJY00DRAFT_316969 [Aspergillus carlsbadensis]|nr:hypothetical protein BJY00DRAFT_316969 [Aspergillus carlsbadensis]
MPPPPPMTPPPDFNIFLALCRPTPAEKSGRWLLILSRPLGDPILETSCITYQAAAMRLISAPGRWHCLKESDKPFTYPDVHARYRLGTIKESQVWMVDEAGRGADPSCGRQRFVLGMVRSLEEQGILERGAGDFYGRLVDER